MKDTITREKTVTGAQLERLEQWSLRKPTIALMGEFSAGKSTLMNLLMERNVLPTQVTATRLPPVWLRYGTEAPYRVDHAGKRHKVDLSNPMSIPLADTRFVRVHTEADILKRCDLIDMPGISDPNIKVDYWINTIGYANAVMWCTHAGQVWRESERGTWEGLPKRLRETSILLVTRKDKISSERDQRKIDRRLERETSHLFNARVFVSLTNALKARETGSDDDWAHSGARDFTDLLEQIVEGVTLQRSYMFSRYVTEGGNDVASGFSFAAPQPEAAPEPAPEHAFTATEASVEAPEAEPVATPVAAFEARETPAPEIETEVEVAIDAPAPEAEADVAMTEAEVQPEPLPEPEPAEPAYGADLRYEAGFTYQPPASYRLSSFTPPPPSTKVDPAVLSPEAQTEAQAEAEAEEDREIGALTDQILQDMAAGTDTPDASLQSDPHLDTADTKSEVGRIQEIWDSAREQFDTEKTPALVSAIERLISDLRSHDTAFETDPVRASA